MGAPDNLMTLRNYEENQQHNKIYNLHQVPNTFMVKIPDEMCGIAFYKLYAVSQISPETFFYNEENLKRCICRDGNRPWLEVPRRFFSLESGLHTYRWSFVDPFKDVMHLYNTYTIQDDNPEKPYVYLKGKERDICQAPFPLY